MSTHIAAIANASDSDEDDDSLDLPERNDADSVIQRGNDANHDQSSLQTNQGGTSTSIISNPSPSLSLSVAQDIGHLLLGEEPRAVARTAAQASLLSVAFCKKDRPGLTLRKKQALIKDATTGLKHEFTQLVPINGIGELQNVYDIGLRIQQYRDACKRHDMDDVFMISTTIQLRNGVFTFPPGPTLNLFTHFNDVSLDTVKLNAMYYRLHGRS
jgi:hypothetical protein